MAYKSDIVLERLHRLHPRKIDLSLNRMTRLLSKMGHPERRLPPVIHVAGTNGKGSTVAYLRAILQASGLKVHVYSSPHLVRFAERIRLAGDLIREEHLMENLIACEKINGEDPITYFEITTAAALKSFADCPADILLMEVGLGGRLDATNVIKHPLSTVITPVSRDHQQFLGTDLGAIALEKAGIAKKDVPLISAKQQGPVKTAIHNHAQKIGAIEMNDWSVKPTSRGFDYQDYMGCLSLPRPRLHGRHQIANAGLAIACLRHQKKITITAEQIAKGITSASWPARLQDISQSPYGRCLPTGSALWLDGGHNPAAGEILADFFSLENPRPLYLICGMMAGKDTRGFLKPLTPYTAKVYGIKIAGQESHSAEEIVELAQAESLDAQSALSVTNALQNINLSVKDKAVNVLICGSLYLAGHVLAENNLLPT